MCIRWSYGSNPQTWNIASDTSLLPMHYQIFLGYKNDVSIYIYICIHMHLCPLDVSWQKTMDMFMVNRFDPRLTQMGHSQLSPDFNIPTSLHWKATGQLQEQYGKPNLIFQHDIDARTMRHIQCLPFSQASHLEMQRFSIPRSGRKISCWPPRKSHAYRLRNILWALSAFILLTVGM